MGFTEAKTKRWSMIVLALLLSLTVGVMLLSAQQVQARVNLITGTVTDPDGGLPPAGSRVFLVSPDGETHGEAQVDETTGAFSLGPVVSGNYILQAHPPFGSEITPSLPEFIIMVGQPIDVGTMALMEPQITGMVYEPDGVTPVNGIVHVFIGDDHYQATVALAGEIRIGGLISGTYGLIAEPLDNDPFYFSDPEIITLSAGMTDTVDFTLSQANAVGFITDPQGLPIPGAKVKILGTVHHTYQEDHTNEDGYFNFGNLPDDTYILEAEAPWWAGGLINSSLVTFHVPPTLNDLGNIPLRQAPKILTGSVETNTGTAVVGAKVIANRIGLPGHHETLTDAAGNYFMRLGGGLWSVTVEPTPLSNPGDWVNPNPPQLIHFDHDLQPEFKEVDFEVLTADSTVIGTIEMPDGSTPSFSVTVNLRNNEGVGRTVEMDPADGSFAVMVPHGNYVLHIQPHDPGYFGPEPMLVMAPESATVDLGVQALIEKDSAIVGVVVDENGVGVGGIQISAWTREHLGTNTVTNPDGSYVLGVSASDWILGPETPYNLPYIYDGEPISLTVGSSTTVTASDFVMTTANNVISGQLVDGNGEAVIAAGAAGAFQSDAFVNFSLIESGHFDIFVPDGTYEIGIELIEDSEWIPGQAQMATVSGGETISITYPLLPKDAAIAGALWDVRNEVVPTDVWAYVMADNPQAWVGTTVDPANGTYHLDVSAGLWLLSYAVDPNSGYVSLDHHTVVAVQSGQTAGVPLPVAEKDSNISGQVLDPNGDPLPGAVVLAFGSRGLISQVTLFDHTDGDGNFSIDAPYGPYDLIAGHANSQWLNPVLTSVIAPPHASTNNVVLQFREPDVTLTGHVSLAPEFGGDDGVVHIWAYSEDGAATFTTAQLGDDYGLALASGMRWHIGATVEFGNTFYAFRDHIFMGGNETMDIVLNGPFQKPAPVSVTFDASEAQTLHVGDGTWIHIPAGAMPVTGDVTLHITPIATLPHQHHARLYKYGYAFIATDDTGTPISANFNQNVIISFAYDEFELGQLGLSEQRLRPAYFSTTTNSWTIPEGYTVNTTENRVIMQIDHFTDYTLINTPLANAVYLPVVTTP